MPAPERGFSRGPGALRASWIMQRGSAAIAEPASARKCHGRNFGQKAANEYLHARLVNIQDATALDPVLPRLAAGEPRAMNECIDRYGALIWGIVRRAIKDNAAAEDLVQEIFTEVWKKAGFFDPAVASEATFIALVARRRSIDFLRRQGRQPGFEPLEAAESIPVSTAPETAVDCDPEAVRSTIAALPDDTRQLFHMFFDDGFTHPEIAEKTGLPLGTVKTRLRRGLLTLRERLSRADISNLHPES